MDIKFKDILCQKFYTSNLSSHDAVVGQIYLPHPTNILEAEPDYSASYTEFNVKKPKWNEAGIAGYQAQTASIISDIMEKFTLAAHIPALTEMCSTALVLSAQLHFDVTNPQKKSTKIFN